jgi:hypothetical protein
VVVSSPGCNSRYDTGVIVVRVLRCKLTDILSGVGMHFTRIKNRVIERASPCLLGDARAYDSRHSRIFLLYSTLPFVATIYSVTEFVLGWCGRLKRLQVLITAPVCLRDVAIQDRNAC